MNINFGNFCVLPRKDLVRLVASADLWNHFAAAVVRSKIPYDVINSTRGTRLDGRSNMNLLSLVTHGLSAVAVFSDRVGVRLLGVTAGLSATAIAVLGLVVWIKFFTDEAIQGWATNAAGLLVIALMILLTLFLGFSLMVLKGRDAAGFLRSGTTGITSVMFDPSRRPPTSRQKADWPDVATIDNIERSGSEGRIESPGGTIASGSQSRLQL